MKYILALILSASILTLGEAQTVNLPVNYSDIQKLQELHQGYLQDEIARQNTILSEQQQITAINNDIASQNTQIAQDVAADQAAVAEINAYTQSVTNVNWDVVALLKVSGTNWEEIQASQSGVNIPMANQLQGLQGFNWSSIPAANYGNWPTCEAKGVNWGVFNLNGATC